MMSVEPGIVDANVLLYAVNVDAVHHAASRSLLEAARDPETRLYLTSQIICEFYSVLTNSRRVAVPASAAAAIRAVSGLLALPGLKVLSTPADAVYRLLQLPQRHPVTGGAVFDLQIVAAMQANNIRTIYTFNAGDFSVFPELKVLVPE